MKHTWNIALVLVLIAALLAPCVASAGEVTPEFFMEMTPDAQQDYMNQTGQTYEQASGGHSKSSSTWSQDAYYQSLIENGPDAETTVSIGTIYVNTANGKSLNMRSRPDAKSAVITSLPNGTALTLFWYENSSWAFVAYRSYFGFCMTRHLSDTPGHSGGSTPSGASVAPGTDANLNTMFNGFQYVNYYAGVKPSNPSGFVNLRWAPTKAAPVQCIYYADTLLRVLATNGTWSQVLNEETGVSGFMMNSFLNRFVY